MNIAQTIYDNWRKLRAEGRLDEVLPSARAWRSVTEDGSISGYDTCEHEVNRHVSIPGSGPSGGNGFAGLIETYFTVRHHNGWGHNLHIHVVEVKNDVLQLPHLAQLFRNVAGVRHGLLANQVSLRRWGWQHHNVYVHGALLGPAASGDVLMADAMLDGLDEHKNMGIMLPTICVGCVSVHPAKGISVKRIEPDSNYSSERWHCTDEKDLSPKLKEAVDSLLGTSPMWSEWAAARQAELQMQGEEKREIHASAFTKGEIKGRADTLLRLLAQSEIELTDAELADVEECSDVATLDRWIDNVLGAKIAADVLC